MKKTKFVLLIMLASYIFALKAHSKNLDLNSNGDASSNAYVSLSGNVFTEVSSVIKYTQNCKADSAKEKTNLEKAKNKVLEISCVGNYFEIVYK